MRRHFWAVWWGGGRKAGAFSSPSPHASRLLGSDRPPVCPCVSHTSGGYSRTGAALPAGRQLPAAPPGGLHAPPCPVPVLVTPEVPGDRSRACAETRPQPVNALFAENCRRTETFQGSDLCV